MNASKEEARKAYQELKRSYQEIYQVDDPALSVTAEALKNLKTRLLCIEDFLLAAERKLPSEDAYDRAKIVKKIAQKEKIARKSIVRKTP